MRSKPLVLLAGDWETTPIVYHFLKTHFEIEKVIIEQPVPRREFINRRIKKLGLLNVSGQILFQLLVVKPLQKLSKKRISEIKEQYRLNNSSIPTEKITHVNSVNSEDSLKHLQQLQPELVIVHGTRIISRKLLQGIN